MIKSLLITLILVTMPGLMLANGDNNQQLPNQLQQLQHELANQQKAKTPNKTATNNQTRNQPANNQQPSPNNQTQQARPNNQIQQTRTNNQFPKTDLHDEAFAKMATTLLPLTPAQIRVLRANYDAVQKAAALPPGVPTKPISTSITVDLSPGSAAPVIRLGAGFVTAVAFVDATGAPWPVQSYTLGNPTAFDIQWNQKNNVLYIQSVTTYRQSNLAVKLKNLDTPVMLELIPGQQTRDTRADIHIPRLGPNAHAYGQSLPSPANRHLLALLDGIPPQGSKPLVVSGCENCAWLYNRKLFLRTQMTLISPAWLSTMSSSDGTHVYMLNPTPVLLTSWNGKTVKMTVQGW